MTPAEIVARWMEPMPDGEYAFGRTVSFGGWWLWIEDHWEPRAAKTHDLNALHEVEARLTDGQLSRYDRELTAAMLATKPRRRVWYSWNASAKEKLLALAEVLLPVVEGKA